MFFDSHFHPDLLRERDDLGEVMARAKAAGVDRMLAVGTDEASSRFAVEFANQYPGRVYASVGLDRDCAGQEAQSAALAELLRDPVTVAVGEVGLDFHRHPGNRAEQERLFRRMLLLAQEWMRPVVVHTRDAEERTMALLRSHVEGWRGPRDRIGVVHCFTGGPEFAAALSEMNFCVSFSGIVTFRNASLIRAAAEIVPEHLLLIETDAPFLAPVPHRGKTNEPARVRHTAETLAKARKCSVEQLAGITRANACRLFGLQE